MYTQTIKHTHVRWGKRTYTPTHPHMQTYSCAPTHTQKHAHTHIHTHKHAHEHAPLPYPSKLTSTPIFTPVVTPTLNLTHTYTFKHAHTNFWKFAPQIFIKSFPMVNIIFFNQIWKSFTLRIPDTAEVNIYVCVYIFIYT